MKKNRCREDSNPDLLNHHTTLLNHIIKAIYIVYKQSFTEPELVELKPKLLKIMFSSRARAELFQKLDVEPKLEPSKFLRAELELFHSFLSSFSSLRSSFLIIAFFK